MIIVIGNLKQTNGKRSDSPFFILSTKIILMCPTQEEEATLPASFLLNRPLENYSNQDIGLVRGILYFEISNNGHLQQVSGLVIW